MFAGRVLNKLKRGGKERKGEEKRGRDKESKRQRDKESKRRREEKRGGGGRKRKGVEETEGEGRKDRFMKH